MSSKVAKMDKDHRIDYFGARIEDKVTHFNLTVIENGIIVNSDKYSEMGSCVEEAFRMTFEEDEIMEVKTSIITNCFMIIEVKSRSK